MENIVIIWVFLFGLLELYTVAEFVITSPSKVGMKGSNVTLDCKYNSSERWYLMQWKRKQPENGDITIITLINTGQSNSPNPLWENNVSEDFRARARTRIFVDENSVKFDLSINGFSCNDTGIYVCEVTSAQSYYSITNLTIAAKPDIPNVIDDEIILEENDTYVLECTALAGIPVADLKWYYKVPGSKDFVWINTESKQEVQKLDDCSHRVVHRIEVIVNEATDGIIYRCQVDSDLLNDQEKKSFYDDVILKLPKKVVQKPQYRTPTKRPIDPTNQGSSIHRCTDILLTLILQYIISTKMSFR